MASKIELFNGAALLKKREEKESKYVGGSDQSTPLYVVSSIAENDHFTIEDLVILKPGNYENVRIDGEVFLYTEITNIAGKVIN